MHLITDAFILISILFFSEDTHQGHDSDTKVEQQRRWEIIEDIIPVRFRDAITKAITY